MSARIAGSALVACGTILRILAHRELRRVGLTDDQFFHLFPVTRYTNAGPYRWMKHPAYHGSFLMFAGMGMIFLGWGGFVVALPTWPFYENRSRWENTQREIARRNGVDGA